MRYVDRDASGNVCSDYANPQRDNHESLPDSHPDLVASYVAREEAARVAALAAIETRGNINFIPQLKQAREAFVTLKARYDALESWARTKGYPG
jgi:hypothetical protein